MQENKPINLNRILVVVAAIGIFMIAIGYYSTMKDVRKSSVPQATRAIPSSSDFETVRNDCGACGTNSVVGGWETEDGRALILSENGTFTAMFDDGPPMVGDWELGGGELCLLLDTGAQSCFSYQQKVDAMKLDNAIYIRR